MPLHPNTGISAADTSEPTVWILNPETLGANSELAICSWALAAGGLASATVIGPSAATRMTSGSGPMNSPPVSPEIEFIHLAAPQNMRFGRSIQHRQRAARCPPWFV